MFYGDKQCYCGIVNVSVLGLDGLLLLLILFILYYSVEFLNY